MDWQERTSLTFLTWPYIIYETAVFGNHGEKKAGRAINNNIWFPVLKLPFLVLIIVGKMRLFIIQTEISHQLFGTCSTSLCESL